ncbi:hypothetical protein Ddc_07064 [Ditylenchus destructor]|nr:hypothetical protein Ddc_07064 [Ditylenchus destructor]
MVEQLGSVNQGVVRLRQGRNGLRAGKVRPSSLCTRQSLFPAETVLGCDFITNIIADEQAPKGRQRRNCYGEFWIGKRFAASRGVTRRPSHQQPHFCHSNLFLKVESGVKKEIPPLRPHLPIVAVWNSGGSVFRPFSSKRNGSI